MILVVGDTHGEWDTLDAIVKFTKPDRVLLVGDCGVYQADLFDPYTNVHGIPIDFIDGNHEDHEFIWSGRYTDKFRGVTYIPRGTISNGVLYIGGADSIDKEAQMAKGMWSPEEKIPLSLAFKAAEEAVKMRVHTVVSHDAPYEAAEYLCDSRRLPYHPQSSQLALSHILETVKPKLWIHGHWHMADDHKIGDTRFISLNTTSYKRKRILDGENPIHVYAGCYTLLQ